MLRQNALGNAIIFLVGIGAALLPSLLLLFGLPQLLRKPARWQTQDTLFLAAAAFVAVPGLLRSELAALPVHILQFLAVWLVYRSFFALGQKNPERRRVYWFAAGGCLGLGIMAATGYLQLGDGGARATGLTPHANLYGQSAFVLAACTALVLPLRYRLYPLGIAGLAILFSGSRAAAFVWLLLVLLIIVQYVRARGLTWQKLTRFLLFFCVFALAGLAVDGGRLGAALGIIVPAPERNLIRGSELPTATWWYADGVLVEQSRVILGSDTIVAYELTKIADEPWRRLQQGVGLEPGSTYTLSAWTQRETESIRPSLQGWGRLEAENQVFTVALALNDRDVSAEVRGPGVLLAADALQQESWTRIWVTFRYEGESPIQTWMVGPAPDSRRIAGTTATFAGIQLEQASSPSRYEPTFWAGSSETASSTIARIPYYEAAWRGFLERPLLGWGLDSFSSYYRLYLPQGGSSGDIPTHSHNLFLQYAFESGSIGLLGLLMLLISLIFEPLRQRDSPYLTIFVFILLLNLVDFTFFYSGIVFPLAAIAGWRAAKTDTEMSVARPHPSL